MSVPKHFSEGTNKTNDDPGDTLLSVQEKKVVKLDLLIIRIQPGKHQAVQSSSESSPLPTMMLSGRVEKNEQGKRLELFCLNTRQQMPAQGVLVTGMLSRPRLLICWKTEQ